MTDTPPGGRRGPAPVAIGLVAFFALVLMVAAVVVIIRPGSGPAGSGAPGGTATTAASPTARPSLEPTDTSATAPPPGPTPVLTPVPTPGPTLAPTAEPTGGPSPAGSWPPAATCRNEAAGITVTYPAAWYAYSGDATWRCLLFDRDPIVIPTQSELPLVAVTIFVIDSPASEVSAELRDPSYWTVLGSGAAAIDGFAATFYELEATGEGFDKRGTLEFAYVVDLGATRSLVMDTRGPAGPEYDENVEILALMAAALEID